MRFPVSFGRPGIAGTGFGLRICQGSAEQCLRRFAPRLVRRIIGGLSLLTCMVALQGCSLMKLAYNQAPEVAYWYLDSHLDFTSEQSVQVKSGLHQLQAWHRQTQLPAYADTLQQLQQQLQADTTAAQTCTVVADVRGKLGAIARQAEPLAASLVGKLDADQIKHLGQKFAKDNAKEEAERRGGNAKASQDKRLQQATERAERLYGPLSDSQQAALAQRLERSRFDARLMAAEKERRQKDTLGTLQPLASSQASTDQALAALHGLLERTQTSPDAAYRTYLDQLGQENCQTFAELHNSTSPAQRSKAVETLKGYVQDLRVLNARKS